MMLYDYLENGYSCAVFRKDTLVFSSKESGIKPLLQIIHEQIDVSGCVAVDKIVGRAAAMLYVCMGVSEVHASVMSEGAFEILNKQNIIAKYKVLTEQIINRRGDGMCPMESAVLGISEPKKALSAIENKISELKHNVKKN